MLGDVSLDFRIGRFGVGYQSVLGISRSQQPRLLEHNLQFNLTGLVDAGRYSAALAQQHLAQLVLDFF